MDIISSDDLASYLRESDPDWTTLGQLVELANGIVSDVLGDPAETTTRAVAITLEAAARAYRNPGGYSSETIDDYTYRLPEDARRAGVFLTATEQAELVDIVQPSRSSSFVGWLA